MGRSTKATMTYHESFGIVSTAQLRAYKAYNVSPVDHDQLVSVYGEDHAAIVAAVKAPEHQLGDGKCFSTWRWMEATNSY